MRIAWLGPPGWAPSGYGVQTRIFTRWLAERGHDVAVLAFAGAHKREVWEGVTYLPAGQRPYGNGLIPMLCGMWKADALVLMCDLWPVEPGQLERVQCPVYPWVPIDAEPLGVMDRQWLEMAAKADVRLVAMSGFGARILGEAGFKAEAIIPHATRPEMMPGDRQAWGVEAGLAEDKFLFAKVGVNDEDRDRKAFAATLQAFAQHSKRHRDSWLYVHTEPQRPGGINLAYMALTLGITDRIRFPQEERRTADLYDDAWMAAMHRRADCYVGASSAEGFGVPLIESLACGTPVIATRGSAMTELVDPAYGRLVSGDRKWASHHHSWWITPGVGELARAMDAMHGTAGMMRPAAERAAGRWTVERVAPLWEELLTARRSDLAEPVPDPAGV